MSGTIAVLTALNLEYQAVREQLVDLAVHRHSAGTRFEVGRLRDGRCRVALVLVGKGNHPAAVLAERAITEFDPAAVFFVGVAGSLRPKIKLGDVIVATHVYAYHGGTSEDDGLKARPRVWEAAHAPDQIARHLDRTGEWANRLATGTPAPAVHFGPIAAGEVVHDSAVSEHARWIQQHYNDALAIEMEAAGVAEAAHLNNALPVIVVRGISDMADGSKAASDGANWQPRAAANAAAFAMTLAEAMHTEFMRPEVIRTARHGTAQATPMTGPGSTAMDTSNRNVATGHAWVGVQAGQVFGNIRIVPAGPTAPSDLPAEIAALRDEIKRAHEAGEVDDGTYDAATDEIDVVARHITDRPTPENTDRLLVALKKLRGLIADVATLAEKVATIIAAVRSIR